LSTGPRGHDQGLTGTAGDWTVDGIQEQPARLVSAGARELQPARGAGGGKLIASGQDPDGNITGPTRNP
jgi:hypothetical protein